MTHVRSCTITALGCTVFRRSRMERMRGVGTRRPDERIPRAAVLNLYQKFLRRFFPSLSSPALPPPPPVRVPLGTLGDFPDGQGKPVVVAGRKIAIFRLGEEVYALYNACPHNRVPLSAGIVTDHALICRAHGARFDLKTGTVLRGPARKPVRTYPVRRTGDDLEIELRL